MEVAAGWEHVLDEIAAEIRDALEVEASTSADQEVLPCARTVQIWIDSLMGLLLERQRQNDPEGAGDVLDVLASLLKASADGQWIHRRDGAAGDDDIFSTERLEMVAETLLTAVKTATDTALEESDEICTHAMSILSSLFFNAVNEAEIDAVLGICRRRVRGTPLENAISKASTTLLSDVALDGAVWAACFLRFVMRWISSVEIAEHESNGFEMLSSLTGIEGGLAKHWIDETWETKWHLHRSTSIGKSLFRSVDDCVATIRTMFRGFSVEQDDAELAIPSTDAAVIMAVRDANKYFGLVHGVDATLIKGGHVHPNWKESSRRIRLEDVDHALTDGYTVGLRAVQARSLSVFRLCSKLQRELGQHVNANLYWTPPGQQGFDRHVDDHCVFAIQLKGRKRWVLYEPQKLLPVLYDDTASDLVINPPRFHAEVILEEGDVLYVPRGVAHHADTKDILEESIHLTIGIEIDIAHTNARILEENQPTESACSDNFKRKALMAWHLSDPTAFCDHVIPLTGGNSSDDWLQKSTSIQSTLKQERALFLTQRSLRARTTATLHEVVHSTQDKKPADGMDGDTKRPSKKQRHQ